MIHKRTQTTHFAHKKAFRKFHLNYFYQLIIMTYYVSYHAAKFEKILRLGPEIQACKIFGHNQAKLPIWPKRGISRKFHLSNSYLLIAHCHAAKFDKNPYRGS